MRLSTYDQWFHLWYDYVSRLELQHYTPTVTIVHVEHGVDGCLCRLWAMVRRLVFNIQAAVRVLHLHRIYYLKRGEASALHTKGVGRKFSRSSSRVFDGDMREGSTSIFVALSGDVSLVNTCVRPCSTPNQLVYVSTHKELIVLFVISNALRHKTDDSWAARSCPSPESRQKFWIPSLGPDERLDPDSWHRGWGGGSIIDNMTLALVSPHVAAQHCVYLPSFAHMRNILKQVMTIYKDKLVGKWTWTDAQLQVIMSLSRLQ